MGSIAMQLRGIDDNKPGSFFTTRVKQFGNQVRNWGRKNSLWPLPFGTACCAIEFMAVVSNKHDMARFGAEVVRFSPRQSDLLVVAGTINFKMAPILRRIYDQMCEPKWVIAMGACAACGGFYDNYATLQGIDRVIPVDVYVPGCPPRPEAVLDGIVQVQNLIDQEGPKAHPRKPIPWPPDSDPADHYDRGIAPWSAPSESIPRSKPEFEVRGQQSLDE